ncbi:hypothetical protein AGMMS49975_15250 [Clostridia bacterium]|nr:hypothetical protein AGMMS49975_15250 [Clostridia bacterium]
MLAVLLVDPQSRVNSVIDIAELKKFDVHIVSDLKEIVDMEYDGEPIVMLDGFVQSENGVSELVLYRELLGFRYIFMSSNDTLLKQMEKHAKVFAFDTSHIGFSIILAAVNDDKEAGSFYLVQPEERYIKLAHMVADNLGSFDVTVRGIASALLNVLADNKRLFREKTELKEELDSLHALNQNKDVQLKYMSELTGDMLRQTVRVNDALENYSFLCQKDTFKKIALDEFRNHPNIIYFKEFGDFLHLESFVRTLAEVFKTQYDCPVKVLWLLDKKNSLRQKYIPEYYTVFADGVFRKPHIQVSDYMCVTGGYDGVLSTICENQTGVEYLIVIDSKLVNDTVIPVADVLRFDLCRSKRKIKSFGLLDSRTIVNNEEDRELSWNHFYEYEQLTEEDRYLYLANRPVIQHIVGMAQEEFSLS